MPISRNRTEVHGHRGCRGYLPENTIPAFLHAIDSGVDAIELDVVITGDRQVLVSHEAWFAAEFCLNPDGSPITSEDESKQNIFKMPYEAIRQYDCGSRPHPRFPEQQNRTVAKPLLTDVIDAVETYLVRKGLPAVGYNIEIKSFPAGDHVFHPVPPVFVDLLMDVIYSTGIASNTMVQSFDVRPLQEINARYKGMALGLLVEDKQPAAQHLESLGFLPFAYNPHYSLLSEELVAYLRKLDLAIYTWTVNTAEAVQYCLDQGVDGIISDYPKLVKDIMKQQLSSL